METVNRTVAGGDSNTGAVHQYIDRRPPDGKMSDLPALTWGDTGLVRWVASLPDALVAG